MKMSKRHDPISYADLNSNLGRETTQLLDNHKPFISFDEVWKLHLNDTVEVRQQNHSNSPIVKWSLGIGAAVLIIMGSIIVSGFISPLMANALRKVPFFEYLYSAGGYPDGLIQIENKKLSTQTNASINDEDIEFKVVEVFYDGIQVVLNYEVNYPESSLNITEKEASVYYHINFEKGRPTIMSTHEFTITGDHSFVGTTLMSFGDSDDLPDKIQLNMSVERIGTTEGKWDVSLPLNKEKSEAITKTIYPDVGFTFENSKFTVEKLVLGPVSTQLVVKGDFEVPNQIRFIIEDDIGTFLSGQGGGGGSENSIHSNFSPLAELNPRPKYITLIMIENTTGQMSKGTEQVVDRLPLKGTYPMVLKGNDDGTLTVTSIDFQEKQTIVYYDVSQPISQLPTIYLENKKGEIISPKEEPIRIGKDSFSLKHMLPEMKEIDAANIVTQRYSNPPNQKMLRVRIPLNWD